MARKAKTVPCDGPTRAILERMAGSHKEQARLVRRARMVLGCVDGRRIKDISAELGEQEDVIIKWRDRFIEKGIAGLAAHPNVFFHYTPTSASWLNQIEIWFNIMTRKALRGASFDSTKLLSEAIHKFIFAYNETSEPFIWKKREVAGS